MSAANGVGEPDTLVVIAFVFQFMLMLVSLYALKTRPAGALPVVPPPVVAPLEEPLAPPLDEPLVVPLPVVAPLEEPLAPPLDEPVGPQVVVPPLLEPPPVPTLPEGQLAGAQSAGVESGVHVDWLVCPWMHS